MTDRPRPMFLKLVRGQPVRTSKHVLLRCLGGSAVRSGSSSVCLSVVRVVNGVCHLVMHRSPPPGLVVVWSAEQGPNRRDCVEGYQACFFVALVYCYCYCLRCTPAVSCLVFVHLCRGKQQSRKSWCEQLCMERHMHHRHTSMSG